MNLNIAFFRWTPHNPSWSFFCNIIGPVALFWNIHFEDHNFINKHEIDF